MPMTVRPGTTATRTEMALIERAISSARPMTRDALMTGAGPHSCSVTTGPGRPRPLDDRRRLEFIQRPARPRPPLHDLAAHAVIFEHGFEHARVAGQRLLVD